jgi:hypothetical protein
VEGVDQQIAATNHNGNSDKEWNQKNRHMTLLWLLS